MNEIAISLILGFISVLLFWTGYILGHKQGLVDAVQEKSE